MKISVIIPTKNRPNFLVECLTTLSRQTRLPDEVIVVDSGSIKPAKSVVDQFPNQLKINYQKISSRNIAASRNHALKLAKGEILAFTDDDCMIDRHWLTVIFGHFRDSHVVGLVGASKNFTPRHHLAQLEQLTQDEWLNKYYPTNLPAVLDSGIFINTRSFAVRKKIINNHHIYFDTRCPHKIEDTDFGIRLFAALSSKTEQILYSPRAVVYHRNSITLVDFVFRKWYAFQGYKWLESRYPGLLNSLPAPRLNPSQHPSLKQFILNSFNGLFDLIFRNIYRFQKIFPAYYL